MGERVTVVAFSIGPERYGVDVSEVLAVVPRVETRRLDGAPAWVEGLMLVAGGLVPLVDLVRLQTGMAARRAFSTRVILVRYPLAGGDTRALGLLAEQVTGIAQLDADKVQATGVAQPGSPGLGDVGRTDGGAVLQFVTVRALLTDEVRALLFQDDGKRA